MRKLLPGWNEILIFAAMAVVCTAIVQFMPAPDLGLAMMAFPVFVISAVIGLWKSGRLRAGDD
jgi:hypothetical protein